MKNDDEIRLLKELANILERQIEFIRHDDLEESEKLVGYSEQVAIRITAAGLLERPEYDGWRKRLAALYKNLELMLSTQKEAVTGQIRSINKGRKTLTRYRDSIGK
jgi:hypothetical protein